MNKGDKKWFLKRKWLWIECVILCIVMSIIYVTKFLFFDFLFIINFFKFVIIVSLIVSVHELISFLYEKYKK